MSERVKWYGREAEADLRKRLMVALDRVGLMMVKDVKESMAGADRFTGDLSGRAKSKSGRPRSLPGEPPAVQTGLLINSIAHELRPERLAVRYGTNIKYGLFLELGTHKMAPRPYLVPAYIRKRKDVLRIIQRAYRGR